MVFKCGKVVPPLVHLLVHQHVLISPFRVDSIGDLRISALIEGAGVADREWPVK